VIAFSSLRTRLIAAFAIVILAALFTAGSAIVWLVQDYQRRISVDRLTEVAMSASLAGRQLEVVNAEPDDIATIVSTRLIPQGVGRVRVLVVDAQARVLADEPGPAGPFDASFVGRLLDLPPEVASAAGGRARGRDLVAWTDADVPGRPYMLITSPAAANVLLPQLARPGQARPGGGPGTGALPPDPRGEAFERAAARPPIYRVVLAVPERDLAAAWRELIPSLTLALVVAVTVAIVAALWLARSIALPLKQITRAAQAIARGDLKQSIPVRGRDEVAQLAASFNSMSAEVERSQRTLREFVANASHELRTPLTSIQGFSQALVDGAVGGEGGSMEAGKIINEEADRMRRLVEDLLYLSRVEAADVPVARDPVDLSALLREVMRRLEHVARQRDLSVSVEAGALPTVPGDAAQLDRVFGNLLENAGKYTPFGGTITLKARADAEKVHLTVHNTGATIPAEDLPRVFDRFYRVDKSRAREVEGSGLGLAIAREVVERHGGVITVDSSEATGTAFTVTLPVAPSIPYSDAAKRVKSSEIADGWAKVAVGPRGAGAGTH
jgi:signal transduction histidine kinase